MAFPRGQTHEEHIAHLSMYNAQLAQQNDSLRVENERLRAQVFKLEKTGQALVRDAKKYHDDAVDLKKALGVRNDQYTVLKNKLDELTRRLEVMKKARAPVIQRAYNIQRLQEDFRKRIENPNLEDPNRVSAFDATKRATRGVIKGATKGGSMWL